MQKYIGLGQYNRDILSKIYVRNDIAGIVAGDLLCDRAMFRLGKAEMNYVIEDTIRNQKEVIYQTPLYVTERNVEEVHDNIMFYHKRYGIDKFIVQDIGLLHWLRCYSDSVEIIWGRMGRNRNQIMNLGFLDFVKGLGIDSMEVDNHKWIKTVKEHGVKIYAVWGKISYGTVSRECYHRYLWGNCGGDCERICRSKSLQLVNEQVQMRVDGHFLGRELRYLNKTQFMEIASAYSDYMITYIDDENPVAVKEMACC